MIRRVVSKAEIKQDYFEWLCNIVDADSESGSYTELMRILFNKPFEYSVPHDDNRAMDGAKLREDYIKQSLYFGEDAQFSVIGGRCSMLEMLIGLAYRIDFELSDPYEETPSVADYFWEMINNLGLGDYKDLLSEEQRDRLIQTIDDLVNRRYEYNGRGGLFPLDNPRCDQRGVEIWYQMNAYLQENYEI